MKRASIHFVLFIAACAGCGGGEDSTVHGTVTIAGQLAPRGTVVFHPVDGGPTAYGTIDDKGSYWLRVGQGDLRDPNAGEIPPGEYIVTAVVNMPSAKDAEFGETGPPRPGARLTAEKYAEKESSDLRVTVKAGANVLPLELEPAEADSEETASDETGSQVDAAPGEGVEERDPAKPEQPNGDQPAAENANEEEAPQAATETKATEPAAPAPTTEEPTQ